MVEHYYVIIGGVGSSPTVLDYFRLLRFTSKERKNKKILKVQQ